jgi:mono/diheme cytochrome c family protein
MSLGGIAPLGHGQTHLLYAKAVRATPAKAQDAASPRSVAVFLRASSTTIQESPATASDIANGQRLFALYGCSECHLSRGQGARATGVRVGPSRLPAAAFINYVREPTGEMPPYTQKTVTDQELANMYAFLQSVPPSAPWKTIPMLNQ